MTLLLPNSFEPALLAELEQVAQHRTAEAGDVLMEPGQVIRYVPIVLKGTIKIMRPDDEGHELLLYYLNASDSCALSLSSLLTGETSPIRAVADDKSELLMVPVERANAWMGQYASWRTFVFQTYQRRFDDLLGTLDAVAFRQLDERLVAYLDGRAKLVGGRHLYLTHDEIARDLNTSREVISRLLKQLEKLGRIRLTRNKISLVVPLR
jgi:CRP/FNR family transcriptional regulator, anaerobic regulatory protein